jgi:predicted nucleotidyltransferase
VRDDDARWKRAQEIYEAVIKPALPAEAHGKYIAVLEDGDYELGASSLEAGDRLRERRPGAVPLLCRVGYITVAEPRPPNSREVPESELQDWLAHQRGWAGPFVSGDLPLTLHEGSGLPASLLREASGSFRYPFVFLTVSGSHLYGFPSADSDFDLRGSHLLPGEALWGLDLPRETVEPKVETEIGLVEIVSHDLRKFVRLLLKRNGYVLEQLTSPLVVRTTPLHAELLRLAPGVLTKNHYYHYRGFYHTERKEYDRSEPRSVKKLLYAYRVLMTGCVLLREGAVEANLQRLNERFAFPFLDELVEIKAGGERVGIPDDRRYVAELEKLEVEMDRAFAESTLPETPSVRDELDRLVVGARRAGSTG